MTDTKEKKKLTPYEIEARKIQIETNELEIEKALDQIRVWEDDIEEDRPNRHHRLEIRRKRNFIENFKEQNEQLKKEINN